MKKLGEWFLPGSPQERQFGELELSAENNYRLQVFNSALEYNELEKLKNIPIIHGITQSGEEVTLFNCTLIGLKIGTLHRKQTFLKVSMVIIGSLIDENKLFNYSSFEIQGFHRWVKMQGINRPDIDYTNKNYSMKLSYEKPKSIEFIVQEGIRIIFYSDFKFSAKYIDGYKKIELNENTLICIRTNELKSIDEIVRLILCFRLFCTFSMGRSVKCRNIELRLKLDHNNTDGFIDLHIEGKNELYIDNLYFSTEFDEDPNEYGELFTYRSIEKNLETVLQKWYQEYNKESLLYKLFTNMMEERKARLDVNFLNIVQLLEVMYGVYGNRKTILSDEKWRDLKERIEGVLSDGKERRIFKKFSRFANEISLAEKIKCLYELYGNEENLNHIFFEKVMHTRNFHTHYTNRKESEVLKGKEWLDSTDRLNEIANTVLMGVMGIS